MMQIDEQKLRQLFKNRSNCYADAEDVVQAMDEDCFIEAVNEALRLFAVVGQNEQLVCDCGDSNMTWYGNDDDKQWFCFNCKKQANQLPTTVHGYTSIVAKETETIN